MLKLLSLVALLSCAAETQAYKILMIPFGNKSHLIEFHGLGQVLMSRGHEVHIYMSPVDTPPAEIANAGYKFVHPNVNDSLMPVWVSDDEMLRRVGQSAVQMVVELQEELKLLRSRLLKAGNSMLQDSVTIERMRREKYDLAVVDNIGTVSYMFLLPYKLGVPYVALSTMHDPIALRLAHFPSAFTDVFFSQSLGVRAERLGSSMLDRIKNLIATAFHEYFMLGWTDELFERENVTWSHVSSRIGLHLVDQHHLLSDPVPTAPHVLMVGGLVTRPPKPLTEPSLLQFLHSSNQSVVVCSFGTMLETLTPAILKKLLGAFGKVPFRVVMRLKNAKRHTERLLVPENVLLLNWLPQNDLLAHPNTTLLITHSGNNGQNEAVYHGTPMVAFHVFGDQMNNAERVVRRGYGVKLNLRNFSEQDLVDAILEVANNPRYRKAIGAASEIFHLKPPGETAANAVEHVIRFGSDHLRPDEALSMSVVEFAMLDVMFVLFTVLFVSAYLVLRVAFALLRYLMRPELRALFRLARCCKSYLHSCFPRDKHFA